MASGSFISNADGTSIRFAGPVFDGRALATCEVMCEAFEREIGRQGVQMIQQALDGVLQHPSGFYRSQIRVDTSERDTVINDNDVVYGPWLEGVGSRNYPITKFEGYHTFEKTYPKLEKKAAAIVAELLRGKYIEEMN